LERRTTSEDVFERLHADIITLKLLPGARLSEVDVAKQFQVSRQPVREAFIRLHDLDLLRVQPQRATTVKRISEQALLNARFIRTAVEVEVLKVACDRDTSVSHKAFEKNLAQQSEAIESNRTAQFHKLDYKFHQLICKAADHEFAYETISANKSQLDRLCLLSLTRPEEMSQIQADHQALYDCIRDGRAHDGEVLIRSHLSRVINLLGVVRDSHPEYFAED
jgi:GntR family transcriptional regulator, rspAB operon transcriptional repressor